jgi:hypothetical protein
MKPQDLLWLIYNIIPSSILLFLKKIRCTSQYGISDNCKLLYSQRRSMQNILHYVLFLSKNAWRICEIILSKHLTFIEIFNLAV